ncbi:MAG: AbrB/MazE/SpoVT family DNA-binding domain-containing protein [Candidatus Lokiarchaeota archaeon]|nr:AbrB/MazE/SpoVT family DNA-binding domain-containing protein [Candidatus Lokiarchaeota archaeon]
MTISEEKMVLKVGSKGEIFPPKEIREKLGLKPNQPIVMTIHQDKLIIRKLYSLDEILKTPPKVKISYHAWKQFKDDLNEEYEK